MKTALEKQAAKIVGDGKLPNKYFLSFSSEYLTDKNEAHHFDWAGEIYSNLPAKHEMRAVFDTFREAWKYADEHAWECSDPSQDFEGFHSICIEDRLSGTCAEGMYYERWQEKTFQGHTVRFPVFEWEWSDDTKFTKETMEKRGLSFE